MYGSTWEAAEAHWLDHPNTADMAAAWARNDHLGFEIRYIYAGGVSKYRPDFLIRLNDGRILVLEVKGQATPRDEAKHSAMKEWVEAVNADGRFGHWCWDVSMSRGDVLGILERHAPDPVFRPWISLYPPLSSFSANSKACMPKHEERGQCRPCP